MRLKLILCKVLQREAYLCASRCPNIVDIVLMPQGLHNTPEILRQKVQEEMNRTTDVSGEPYDAILLGYGLCSNGIVGLTSTVPVVVARGHDCITLLLGSRKRYRDYFDSHKGIYWYSVGWIESAPMPGKHRCEQLLQEYTEKYGADNAQYLLELEQTWIKEYKRAVFIDWHLPGTDDARAFTKQCAASLSWDYDELEGDSTLFQRLLDGDWSADDFLTIQPGQMICEDLTSEQLIKAHHCQQCRESR